MPRQEQQTAFVLFSLLGAYHVSFIFQAIAVVCADALAAPAVAPEFERTEKTVYSILIRDKWFKDTIW